MEAKLCIQFLLIAIGLAVANAQYSCYVDDQGKTTECKIVNECYVIYNKKSGQRNYGCFIKMTDSQRRYCSQNPALCATCSGNNCNTKDLIKMCVSCKTSGTGGDERCTTNPTEIASQSVVACNNMCYTKTEADGTNVRGCFDRGEACGEADLKCYDCKGDVCNTNVFPKTRRVCNTKNETKEICLNEKDSCISIINQQGDAVKLGCTESLFKNTNLKKMCEKNPSRCPQCNENECNGSAKKKKCVVCDEKDPNCLENPEDVEKEEQCIGKCFFYRDGDKVKRGCNDKFKCEKETCLECDEDFCTTEMCYPA